MYLQYSYNVSFPICDSVRIHVSLDAVQPVPADVFVLNQPQRQLGAASDSSLRRLSVFSAIKVCS